jgi:hypothetical protein
MQGSCGVQDRTKRMPCMPYINIDWYILSHLTLQFCLALNHYRLVGSVSLVAPNLLALIACNEQVTSCWVPEVREVCAC